MNAIFDKLNLTPSERRLTIAFLIVLFTMINMWFVWPHFEDWEQVQMERQSADLKVLQHKYEIIKIPDLEAQLREIEFAIGTNGFVADSRAQRNTFQRTIDSLASKTGVQITLSGAVTAVVSSGSNSNQFFTELSRRVTVVAHENELVDFLYELGNSDARIRVKDLTLNPAPADKTALQAMLTLIASYKKNQGSDAKPSSPGATSTDIE